MIRRCFNAVSRFGSYQYALMYRNADVSKGLMCTRPELHCPSSLPSVRALSMSLWPFRVQPRDFSQPNSSWSTEMRSIYDHYYALCDDQTEDGETKKALWRKLPSYNRTLKYSTAGMYVSKLLQSKARLFTRMIKEQGAAFEYVMFVNKQEKRCVCVLQAGHLLEGPPGHVHGGAIATMIDTVTGTLAAYLSGPVMTANLNINYRSPIPLGSVVLLHASMDWKERRKTFVSCRVTSHDEAKLHTEATALFVSVNVGNLLGS